MIDRHRAASDSAASPGRARLVDRLVGAIWRHPWIVLSTTLLIAIGAGSLASRLALRSNLAELLQSDDPVAREVRRISDRLPSTLMMVVALEGPDRVANEAAATAIAQRLETLQPRLVNTVVADIRSERTFFEQRKWLYADLATLKDVRDALRGSIARAKNPLLVQIDDSDSPTALLERLRKQHSTVDRFPTGFFESSDGNFVIVLVRPARGAIGEDVGRELRDATRTIVAELPLDPTIHVELGGNLIVGLDERAALMRDLARASLACLVLVAFVVIVFFGRLRVVALFGVPALIGITIGYGMAELAWGFVNMSAAFMGTIIAGNGINFAIIQQARYDEERRTGTAAREAAIIAVRTTCRATLIAALGAAIAYGSLMVTQFRGFSQFGAVGATGMISAWSATIVVMPALWAVFDRGPARRRFRSPTEAAIWRRLGARPVIILCVGAALSIAAVVKLPGYLHDPFEYDLTKLRNRSTAASAVSSRVEEVFGETVAPPVILAERRDQVPEIRKLLTERAATPDGKQMISAVRTIDDFIPTDQQAKLVVLADLRTLIDSLDPEDVDDPKTRQDLAELRPPESLRSIAVADLPSSVQNLFTEVDGTVGRIVLIYDHPKITAYDGHAQLRMAELIGNVPLRDGSVARSPILFAALIRGIVHDAPIATGLSLLGVIALVALFDRTRRGVPLVVGALVIGVLWMVGAAAWVGVKVNFLNFIALPITFGIGVDYAINMYRRCELEGPGRIGHAARAVGGALVLCSSTTVIGYGSLLAADNQALRSFGAMAMLGEIATLLAAITILPAALVVLERRFVGRRIEARP